MVEAPPSQYNRDSVSATVFTPGTLVSLNVARIWHSNHKKNYLHRQFDQNLVVTPNFTSLTGYLRQKKNGNGMLVWLQDTVNQVIDYRGNDWCGLNLHIQ